MKTPRPPNFDWAPACLPIHYKRPRHFDAAICYPTFNFVIFGFNCSYYKPGGDGATFEVGLNILVPFEISQLPCAMYNDVS